MAGTAFPSRLSARLPSGGPEVELALIPAGVFTMGDALGRSPERDTRPAHEVFLDAFFGTPQCASNVVSAVLGRPRPSRGQALTCPLDGRRSPGGSAPRGRRHYRKRRASIPGLRTGRTAAHLKQLVLQVELCRWHAWALNGGRGWHSSAGYRVRRAWHGWRTVLDGVPPSTHLLPSHITPTQSKRQTSSESDCA